MHIIETAASIPTKFCTVIKTTKCHFVGGPTWASQIQDGGLPPSWKNRKKTPYLINDLTDRRENLAR